MLAFTTRVTAAEASFVVVSVIVGVGTVASVLHFGAGARIVTPGVLGCDLALASSIWRTGIWFIVAVAWSCSVWVVVTNVGILGLVYRDVGDGTVMPGVLGCDIVLSVSTWRTGRWILVAVAWSHSVWVVMTDVGMLGLMLVWVG